MSFIVIFIFINYKFFELGICRIGNLLNWESVELGNCRIGKLSNWEFRIGNLSNWEFTISYKGVKQIFVLTQDQEK